jgi:putative spermidine/putrescine transport system ATP-binding protein
VRSLREVGDGLRRHHGRPLTAHLAPAAPAVEFREVARTFGAGAGAVRAVDCVSFRVEPGEFFAMLGPSGSGKTTCLRLIAGFDLPDAGYVLLEGRDVSAVPPYERNVNTVFQDYALFPHMTVLENVAYGPRMRKVGVAERSSRAREMLDLVKLRGFEDRRPAQLSGGQKQRVALARALINQPRVLLLDEPLGALDLKLREEMQIELRNLQKRLGITFIYVTHDQGEALSMSDRVAVFNAGRIEQMANARELYARPRTPFVARFVGGANVAQGDVATHLAGVIGSFAVRTESVQVLASDIPPPSGHVAAEGTVLDVQFHGATSRWQVRLDVGEVFSATRDTNEATHVPAAAGERVRLAWPRSSMVALEEPG